jgi:hypothetical protein
MKACPNCGRATQRTKDWACQWCGYPLLSGGYKILPETYAELKAKRKYEEKPAVIPEPQFDIEPEPERPAPRAEPPAPVRPRSEPPPRPVARVSPPPEPTRPVTRFEPEPEPETEVEEVSEPVMEAKPEPEVKPPPAPAVEAEPAEGAPLSVDYLFSRLQADRAGTEAKYKDQGIKITGLVYRTVINENLTVAYVILTSAKRLDERQVTCTFDRKHEAQIRSLNQGDSATVQGVFDSYTATVLMRDCEII